MKIRLSKTQEKIVQHSEGALLVVAGPGSGKTRVLTERIRRILSEEKGHFRILALTFTNKAANEMKERLEEFPDINQRTFIGTLHSFCVEVLANRGKPVGIEGLPNIFELFQDRKQVLLQAVLEDPELNLVFKGSGDSKDQDKLLWRWLEMIGNAKNNLLIPEMIDDEIESKVYTSYNEGLRSSNAIDYDDLLFLTYRLFTERPKIADFYRRQYRYICVDEAQDLNEAQYRLICSLCGNEYKNVMMVGDPKQAIFVWNGADPKYMDMFLKYFSAKKIAMNENFRSSKAIVAAAKSLSPEYQIVGEYPIQGEMHLIVADDQEQEADLVINYLDDLIKHGHKDIEGDVMLDRCALIARNRYVFSIIEKKLKSKKWPFYKHLSTQHESESDLLKDFALSLRVVANPFDFMHLDLLLKRWKIPSRCKVFSGYESGLDILKGIRDSLAEDNQLAVLDAVEAMEFSKENFKFLKALETLEKYSKTLSSDEARALIINDIRLWKKHWDVFLRTSTGGQLSLTSFLGQVALGATQQPRQEGLALLTVHSAKGLEFDVVVVMGMAEGTFPDYRATGSALEEEKRNAFVAVTRSKRLLCLTYSKTKIMPWGDPWFQKPSRYLKSLGLLN